jgi:transcription initiation factor TFIIIB Brf1 subunit/transcription initiation factor TFIIB
VGGLLSGVPPTSGRPPGGNRLGRLLVTYEQKSPHHDKHLQLLRSFESEVGTTVEVTPRIEETALGLLGKAPPKPTARGLGEEAHVAAILYRAIVQTGVALPLKKFSTVVLLPAARRARWEKGMGDEEAQKKALHRQRKAIGREYTLVKRDLLANLDWKFINKSMEDTLYYVSQGLGVDQSIREASKAIIAKETGRPLCFMSTPPHVACSATLYAVSNSRGTRVSTRDVRRAGNISLPAARHLSHKIMKAYANDLFDGALLEDLVRIEDPRNSFAYTRQLEHMLGWWLSFRGFGEDTQLGKVQREIIERSIELGGLARSGRTTLHILLSSGLLSEDQLTKALERVRYMLPHWAGRIGEYSLMKTIHAITDSGTLTPEQLRIYGHISGKLLRK